MEIAIYWFFFSIIAGVIAGSKGRSAIGFFLLSVILSPLIGIICALVAGRNVDRVEGHRINDGSMRRCPYCAELVRSEAVKCKHCGSDISTVLAPAVKVDAPPPLKPSPGAYNAGRTLGGFFRRNR